jgi:cation transport regulator ChaB
MRELPDEIEQYRDRKWRREDALKIETAEEAEAMVGRISDSVSG